MEDATSTRCVATRGFQLLALPLLLHLCASSAAGVRLQGPVGAAGGQAVVPEGAALALSCEDEGDVRLAFPTIASAYDAALPEVMHRRAAGRWNASLLVRAARPAHTGFYNCSASADPASRESVYVYVSTKSLERPWVLDSDDARQQQMNSQFSAHLGSTATMDCRPNNPTTVVRLRDDRNRTMTLGRQPDGAELSWDPRVGFRLGPVQLAHSGSYWCEAQGSKRDRQVRLQVVAEEVVAPRVWADKTQPVAPGADVVASCELATPRRLDFNLTWASPHSARINEGFRWMAYGAPADAASWHRHTKLLYLFNVREADAGDYVCTADDLKGNRRTATFTLRVQGAGSGVQTEVVRTTAASSASAQPGSSSSDTPRPQTQLLLYAAVCALWVTVPPKLQPFC